MTKFETLSPDFEEWPHDWMGLDEDLVYGKELLEEFRPFAEYLVSSGLSDKTIKKHLTNLWLLGGELVRKVSNDEEYDIPPQKLILDSIDSYGGPSCRHLHSEDDEKSFDSTCKKLYKFIKNNS
jgi:hypothetical protein